MPASMPNTGTPAFLAVSSPAVTCAGSALSTIASTFWLAASSMRLMTPAMSPLVSTTLTVQPFALATSWNAST